MSIFHQPDLVEYVVYGLRDPRDEKFHYVGITMRPKQRKSSHFSGKDNTTGDWIRSLGYEPEFVILSRFLCDDWSGEAVRYEIAWIRLMRSRGHPLLNYLSPWESSNPISPQLQMDHESFVAPVAPCSSSVPFVLSSDFRESFSAFLEYVRDLLPEGVREVSYPSTCWNSSMFVTTRLSSSVMMVESKRESDGIVPMTRRCGDRTLNNLCETLLYAAAEARDRPQSRRQ